MTHVRRDREAPTLTAPARPDPGGRARLAAGPDPAGRRGLFFCTQSVRAAEDAARSSRGYDAGKKVQGRKRHIAVDVLGLLLTVLVTAASVQDRDAAKLLLWMSAPGVLIRPARLGRRRLRRQAHSLGQVRAQAHRPDRPAAR
jgi:Transposase DDE domain